MWSDEQRAGLGAEFVDAAGAWPDHTWARPRRASVAPQNVYNEAGFLGGSLMDIRDAVHSDPETMGGTPVFVGTRVPVQSLFDYIEGGDTLDEFLDQFPSVTRERALTALDAARDFVLAGARTP